MTENTKCKSLLAAVLTMAGALNSHGAMPLLKTRCRALPWLSRQQLLPK